MAKHMTTAEKLSVVDFVYDAEYCDGVAKTYRPVLLEDDHRHLAKQAYLDDLRSVERQQLAAWIHGVDDLSAGSLLGDLVTERRGYLVEPLDLSNPFDC